MVRSLFSCLLVAFASLTILPGCAQFPSIASDPLVGSKRLRELAQRCPPDDRNFSTAFVTEETQPKSIAEPTGNASSAMGDHALRPADVKDPPKRGDSGVVTIGDTQAGDKLAPPKTFLPGVIQPQFLPRTFEKSDKTDYAPAVKAMQDMIDGRHQEAIQHLRAYDDATQEFLLRLLPPLTMFLKKSISEMSPQEVAVLIEQIDGLRWTVRARSELTIGKMCCCKQILGFANYVPVPDTHAFLTASKERPGEWVQLYVELKNFASELSKDGDYVTRLACSLELKNAKGESVWSRPFDKNQTTMRRQARLNDLHGAYCFYVPALPAGKYQLIIEIADETTNPERPRVARKSLDFHVTPVVNQANLR